MADTRLRASMREIHPPQQDHADQVLHDQLLAVSGLQSVHHPSLPRPQPNIAVSHIQPTSTGQRDHNNIDPAIAGTSGMITTTDTGTDDSVLDGRKVYGKRELSTSKRAAQNRAAQRAFRQRKEGYIRKLEEQVKDYEMLSENYKAIQAENYQLREYIISLQSRLIDSQNEVPELPGNIDLSQPRTDPVPLPGNATSGPQHVGIAGDQPEQVNALNRIAVAGLGMRKHQHEEAAFLGNNYPTKRLRSDGTNESGSTDGPQGSKTESAHGTAVAT